MDGGGRARFDGSDRDLRHERDRRTTRDVLETSREGGILPLSQPAPDSNPVLSIVLAIYNERPSLPELFRRLRALDLPPWEVIAVDDGSTDGSRELLSEEARSDPRIRTILHDGKQTTLRAQVLALESARGEYAVVMDSDLQHPPELLSQMVERLKGGADLVVATRYRDGGTPGPRSPLRAVVSRGADGLTKLLLRESRAISDPVSGFFAFRRGIYVPLDRGYRGYKLLLFLLVMSRGENVQEVGFRFEPRTEGASKVTQGLAFVRVFLIELLLARRLAARLSRQRPATATVVRTGG